MQYPVLDLDSSCNILQAGGVIAYPTETFYGLGCDALNPDAVGAIYAMKKRAYGLPLPVVIGSRADLDRIAVDITPLAHKLMDLFWPGPLSIIFTASPEVPDLLTAGTGRIAARFSPHPGCIALCRATGCVLTASSANISGNPPAATPQDLDPEFGPTLAGVFVASPAPHGGRPSTIVDIVPGAGGDSVRVLREGAIRIDSLRNAGFTLLVADE